MRPSRYTTADARACAVSLRLPTDANTVEQLRIGMEIEHEHDDLIKGDPFQSAMIAAAHIREDPLYYLFLVALENFRDGHPQGSKGKVGVHQTAEGATVVLHLLGHDEPLWGHTFTDPAEAEGVALLAAAASQGLTPAEALMLTKIYSVFGLDPTKPLVETPTSRKVPADGSLIDQTFTVVGTTVTVQQS